MVIVYTIFIIDLSEIAAASLLHFVYRAMHVINARDAIFMSNDG